MHQGLRIGNRPKKLQQNNQGILRYAKYDNHIHCSLHAIIYQNSAICNARKATNE
jgi:hypothetical protein